MPLITDKFGKASIPTDVAIATTVKTTRAPGTLVLEAIDLSKYATDTPVFVVTYKKTTDPVTNVVSITQLVSYKALVNTGANTLTNLTVAPGYADIGNAIGDFIECIPTTYRENSLIDGILTSLNPDGTLKTSAVQSALGIVNTPSVGWNIMAQALSYVSNDGYGNFSGSFNGDVTGFLKEGHKLLVPRSIAVGTQCMNFNAASSQTASRLSASLTNVNFTNTWSVLAKINPRSYPTSGTGNSTRTIIARRPAAGNNGWGFRIGTDGQLEVYWANGTTYTTVSSFQCPPLAEWETIAISATASTRTVSFYINGQLIGTYTATSGDTAVGQTGDLSIGGVSMLGEVFFDGFISNLSLWNIALTGTQVGNYANIELAGNEAGMVGYWKGTGNFNDSHANANNLTANNGAAATQADNPFKDTEYFYVTQVGAFSGGITPVKLFGGTKHTLPNQAVGVINYSNAATPAGFPAERGAWRYKILPRMSQIDHATMYGGAPGVNFYDEFRAKIVANVGKWKCGYEAYIITTTGAAVAYQTNQSVLTTQPHNTAVPTPLQNWPDWGGVNGHRFFKSTSAGNTSCSQWDSNNIVTDVPITISTQLALNLLYRGGGSGINNLYHNGQQSHCEVYFEIAYP